MTTARVIRWMSGIGLVVLLLFLGGIVALRVHRKNLSQTTDHVIPAEPVEGPALGVNKDFKYLERIDGRLVFALEALQTLGKKSGWHDIQGVSLQLYGDDQKPGPLLTCEKASFNSKNRDARLSGNIHVLFPDGSFLSTDTGSLDQGGRSFSTNSQVIFIGKTVLGSAKHAHFNMGNSLLALSGGVMVQTAAGNTMTAPRLEYLRKRGVLRFPNGAEFSMGPLRLRAGSGFVEVDEKTSEPMGLHLKDGVEVHMDEVLSGRLFSSVSETLDAKRDVAGSWQVKAATTSNWVRLTIFGGKNVLEQSLWSWQVKAVFGQEGLKSARSLGRSCFRIIPYEGPPRRGESEKARLWFNDGEISNIELDQAVVLREEAVLAKAYNARIDASTGQVMLQGNPDGRPRVTLISDRGKVQADQALLTRDQQKIELHGRVQGERRDVHLIGNTSGGPRGNPEVLHVAADGLIVFEDDQDYQLKGNARVWQGEKLLVADRMNYEKEKEHFRAAGHVRTTFPASLLDPKAPATDDVVLVSRSMDFQQSKRQAHYQGQVVFTGPNNLLSASDLVIEFDAVEDEVSRVTATGAVEMEDLSHAQKLNGTHVVRDMKTGLVVVEGEPARATDAKGNMLAGHTLTFSEADGSVSVAEETETIYHSEEAKTESEKP